MGSNHQGSNSSHSAGNGASRTTHAKVVDRVAPAVHVQTDWDVLRAEGRGTCLEILGFLRGRDDGMYDVSPVSEVMLLAEAISVVDIAQPVGAIRSGVLGRCLWAQDASTLTLAAHGLRFDVLAAVLASVLPVLPHLDGAAAGGWFGRGPLPAITRRLGSDLCEAGAFSCGVALLANEREFAEAGLRVALDLASAAVYLGNALLRFKRGELQTGVVDGSAIPGELRYALAVRRLGPIAAMLERDDAFAEEVEDLLHPPADELETEEEAAALDKRLAEIEAMAAPDSDDDEGSPGDGDDERAGDDAADSDVGDGPDAEPADGDESLPTDGDADPASAEETEEDA